MSLIQTCPRCGADIPPDAPEGFCPRCLISTGLDLDENTPNRSKPKERHAVVATIRYFGDYELLEEIGHGGMGIVYKARQTTLDRVVAVKMLLLGQYATEEFVRRFRAEAEAVARLQHPNIVAIHEVGNHERQHYFSMDYVEGASLGEMVRDNPMPAERAAAYLRTIAEAIHYSHQRGVVHRDLKPSNVLIDADDEPRITDFSVAKLLDADQSLTVTGQVMGSPQFMSPEQAQGTRGRVGPQSDVYSLGALLYYVITGRPPFVGESLTQTLEQVVNSEPVSPRLLNPSVPLDLETIVRKCLEKNPERRYRGAQELADDLNRFLRGEPVCARPVGRPEKIWRWCRRNPVVAGLTAALILALAVGFAAVTWKWIEAEQAGRAARKSAAKATALNKFLINDLLSEAAPERNAVGSNVTLRAVLDTAAQKIEQELSDQPELQAEVRHTIGSVYLSLSLTAEAEPHLLRALAVRRSMLGSNHSDTLAVLDRLATLRQLQSRNEDAERLFREVLNTRRRILGSQHSEVLESLNNLGVFLSQAGRASEAESIFREALNLSRRIRGANHPETFNILGNLAWTLQVLGKVDQAEELLRGDVEAARRAIGPTRPNGLTLLKNYATVLQRLGRLPEAEALFREVVETRRVVQGKEHYDTVVALADLGSFLSSVGKLAESKAVYQECVQISLRLHGREHVNTLAAISGLGWVLQALGETAEAEALLQDSIEPARRILGAQSLHTLSLTKTLATVLQRQGKFGEAEPLFREVLETRRLAQGTNHYDTVIAMNDLAVLLRLRENLEEAGPLMQQTVDLAQKIWGLQHANTLAVTHNLGVFMLSQNKWEEAEKVCRETLASRRKILSDGNAQIADSLVSLGEALVANAKSTEAEPLLREAIGIYAKTLPPGHVRAAQARSVLGGALGSLGRYQEAEPLVVESARLFEADRGISSLQRRRARARVVKLYDAWGKPQDAQQWRDKSLSP